MFVLKGAKQKGQTILRNWHKTWNLLLKHKSLPMLCPKSIRQNSDQIFASGKCCRVKPIESWIFSFVKFHLWLFEWFSQKSSIWSFHWSCWAEDMVWCYVWCFWRPNLWTIGTSWRAWPCPWLPLVLLAAPLIAFSL